MSKEPLYRIPDLEWKKEGDKFFIAAGELHYYEVFECRIGWRWRCQGFPTYPCDSLASGKSAANAHFHARMARGLVEVQDTKGTQ